MVAKNPAKKTVKKVVSKAKAPVRKRSVATRASSKKATEMQSFRLYKESPQDFRSFKVTRQTVYWSILLAVIIVTQLWILKIQMEIAELTNSLVMMP